MNTKNYKLNDEVKVYNKTFVYVKVNGQTRFVDKAEYQKGYIQTAGQN